MKNFSDMTDFQLFIEGLINRLEALEKNSSNDHKGLLKDTVKELKKINAALCEKEPSKLKEMLVKISTELSMHATIVLLIDILKHYLTKF